MGHVPLLGRYILNSIYIAGMVTTIGAIGNSETRFCAARRGDVAIAEGKMTRLTVNPDDCHAFDDSGRVLRRHKAPELVA